MTVSDYISITRCGQSGQRLTVSVFEDCHFKDEFNSTDDCMAVFGHRKLYYADVVVRGNDWAEIVLELIPEDAG